MERLVGNVMDASRFGNSAYGLGIARPLDPTDSGDIIKSTTLAEGIATRVNRRALVMGRLGGTLLTEHASGKNTILYSKIEMAYEILQLKAMTDMNMSGLTGSYPMKPYGIWDGMNAEASVGLHLAAIKGNSAVDMSWRIGLGTIGYNMTAKRNTGTAIEEYKASEYGKWYMPFGIELSYPSLDTKRWPVRPEAIGAGIIQGSGCYYGYGALSVNPGDSTRLIIAPKIVKMFNSLGGDVDFNLKVALSNSLVVGGGVIGAHMWTLNTTTFGAYGELMAGSTKTLDNRVFAGNVVSFRAGYFMDKGSDKISGVGGMPMLWISISGK